jgi:hypothetical protein
MTNLRFRLTYKDDEPEVVRLLCSGQLGQQWGTQVTHHHEKGDGGSRQVTDDSKLEHKANVFLQVDFLRPQFVQWDQSKKYLNNINK